MITQLVPSETSVANLPAVAARIVVPAVLEPIGLTFEDAEFIAKAAMVLIYSTLPVKDAGAGSVTVQVAVVL